MTARSIPGQSAVVGGMTIGKWLVGAAAVFNLALCFIETRGWLRINNAEIALVELSIMAVGLFVIRDQIDRNALLLLAVTLGYLAGAKLVNPTLSVKIVHDLGIMYIFYQLGRMGGMSQARSALTWTMTVVLAFGAFEAISPALFGQVFNVWDYYVQKGVITADTVNYSGTNLFLSGNRGGSASRAFFPSVFGPHRISSVFLEPDSLGNFAAIVFAWCLSTSRNEPGQRRIVLYLLSGLCVVLADSRFASGCCLIMLMLRLSPFRQSAFVAFVLPILVGGGLTIAGSLAELPGVLPAILKDDLSGRLLFSGRLLDYWQLPQWFALAQSPVYVSDTGYAYTINSLGLPLTAAYLAVFAFHRPPTQAGAMMRNCLSAYFATSLCIGASVFTIKTAALMWLLYGALNVSTRRRPLQSVPQADPLGNHAAVAH